MLSYGRTWEMLRAAPGLQLARKQGCWCYDSKTLNSANKHLDNDPWASGEIAPLANILILACETLSKDPEDRIWPQAPDPEKLVYKWDLC